MICDFSKRYSLEVQIKCYSNYMGSYFSFSKFTLFYELSITVLTLVNLLFAILPIFDYVGRTTELACWFCLLNRFLFISQLLFQSKPEPYCVDALTSCFAVLVIRTSAIPFFAIELDCVSLIG